ncbi:hypothetical protein AK812_SmicGene40051 [Symbiodinium microadriaticum]|uniref:Sushi domain-containing protein n=1 Tax=Symbiodinium microadriaticum TaxID=2951 RepID=A0A1Q9C9M4_SYMMI|nr:hypothetical protein AK812_SmicGene40051 [Symbiodinium microadriaticum]
MNEDECPASCPRRGPDAGSSFQCGLDGAFQGTAGSLEGISIGVGVTAANYEQDSMQLKIPHRNNNVPASSLLSSPSLAALSMSGPRANRSEELCKKSITITGSWEIGGNATVMLCDDTPLSSAGFAEYVGRLTCLPDSSFNGTISEVVESSCPDRAQVTGYASTCQDKKPGDECCLAIASPSWVYCETGYTGNPAPYMCDADTLTFVAKDANASCVGSGGRRLSGSGGSSGSGVADGSICIAHCSRGYELVGVASVLTCNSGSLSGNLDGIFEEGTLPVCTPLPCTYNGPDAVGLQHNCSNVTPLEGTSLRRGVPAVLAAPRRYECQSDGNITGVLPDCVGNPCENSIPSDQAFSGEVTWKPSLSTWEFQRQNGPGDLTLKELLMRYELTSGAAGEVAGARSIKPGQPIVCPSLNPSDVLADNCTGVLLTWYIAGSSDWESANATSSSFNCDLSGGKLSIPRPEEVAVHELRNRHSFRVCYHSSYWRKEREFVRFRSGPARTQRVASLRSAMFRWWMVTPCAALCLQPVYISRTDGTCAVTCAAGWQGGSSTLSAEKVESNALNGTYPECLEVSSVTTTSTTYWNGTVLFGGYLDVAPNEGFLNDTLSVEGLTHALAELLDVSETDVEEVVRPFFNAYRPFYTSAQSSVSTPELLESRGEEAAEFANNLSAYLDSKVDANYRIGELLQQLGSIYPELFVRTMCAEAMLVSFDQGSAPTSSEAQAFVVEEPEEEDSNVQWLIGALIAVVVCACLLYFLYWIWNKTEKRYAEPPPAAEQPKEEKPAVGEVLVEMSELQEDSDEDDGGAADGGVTDEMKRMMQEAGVNFGEEDSNDGANLQVEALPSNEEGLADMLALAGVVFEEEIFWRNWIMMTGCATCYGHRLNSLAFCEEKGKSEAVQFCTES